MKIAVDLDGVCYEFQRTYRYMIREYRGVEMPPVDEFWFYWDAQQEWGGRADHKWMWEKGVDLGLFRYGHMVTGARRGLEALHAAGDEIKIVTSRPGNAVQDTSDWCHLYLKDIPYTLDVLSHREPKSIIDADVLVDDKTENVVDWYYHTDGTAILFDQPWNRDVIAELPAQIVLAMNWKEVTDVIARLRPE